MHLCMLEFVIRLVSFHFQGSVFRTDCSGKPHGGYTTSLMAQLWLELPQRLNENSVVLTQLKTMQIQQSVHINGPPVKAIRDHDRLAKEIRR